MKPTALFPIETYFSVLQRKTPTPNDLASLEELAVRLLSFKHYYEAIAKAFEWKFTRADLHGLLKHMQSPSRTVQPTSRLAE